MITILTRSTSRYWHRSTQQNALTMMICRKYGGNVVFTFPGNAWEAQTIKNDTIDNPNRLIYQSPLGTNFWSATNLNTGELKYAGTLDGDMTSSEFNTLAASLNWSDFDATFKSYNSGDANLSFVNNYIFPSNGDIYQIQLNDEIRAFLLVKNVTKSRVAKSLSQTHLLLTSIQVRIRQLDVHKKALISCDVNAFFSVR